MKPKDLFSDNAADYSVYRPDYPQDLFDFIFSHVSNFDTAWDCGTGNGQAAKVLSQRFRRVFATDISDKQMASGFQADNIFYSTSSAEKSSFPNAQFDLITVAQAAHWFKLPEFYTEVKRVAKPNSILAIWGYGLLGINKEFDSKLNEFYIDVIGPYWDPERKFIDQGYQTIPFPFSEVKVPEFHFTKQWTIAQLEGYLNTWSAVQKYVRANSHNPVREFIKSVSPMLKGEILTIQFPLFVRAGFVG